MTKNTIEGSIRSDDPHTWNSVSNQTDLYYLAPTTNDVLHLSRFHDARSQLT